MDGRDDENWPLGAGAAGGWALRLVHWPEPPKVARYALRLLPPTLRSFESPNGSSKCCRSFTRAFSTALVDKRPSAFERQYEIADVRSDGRTGGLKCLAVVDSGLAALSANMVLLPLICSSNGQQRYPRLTIETTVTIRFSLDELAMRTGQPSAECDDWRYPAVFAGAQPGVCRVSRRFTHTAPERRVRCALGTDFGRECKLRPAQRLRP